MTDKSLENKAIKIQGKSYVLVSDRISYFNSEYPNGSIHTDLISNIDGKYIIKATVYPDVLINRFFTGYSQADEKQGMVNKTAAVENCETSAVGRALAMLGIGVIDSVASVDELSKAGVSTSLAKPIATFTGKSCPKCGAPMKISAYSGKEYCSKLCWKNPLPIKIAE